MSPSKATKPFGARHQLLGALVALRHGLCSNFLDSILSNLASTQGSELERHDVDDFAVTKGLKLGRWLSSVVDKVSGFGLQSSMKGEVYLAA